MLATLITAATLAVSPAQVADDPAGLVPANTLIYFGTHSVRAGSDSAQNSAMRLILDEPEVRAFLDKPVKAADRALTEMMHQADVSAEDANRFSLSTMLSGSEEGAPIGKVFLALTHLSVPTPGSDSGGMPDIGLAVGIELLETDDVAMLQALWTRIELPEETATHGGHEYLVKVVPDGPRISLAFLGNLAVATLSEKTLHAIMDRHAGDGGGLDTLAGSSEYQQLLTTSGGMQPGASSYMIRVGPIGELLRGTLGMFLMTQADADMSVATMVMSILDGVGLTAMHWAGGVSYRSLDGRVHSTNMAYVDRNSDGLIAQCMTNLSSVDISAVEGVPGNCLAMSADPVDWLPAVYDFGMSSFEAIAPDEYGEFQGMLAGFMGESDLRNDLLANVHGTMLSYTLPGEGFPGTPSSVMRVPLHDPDKFVSAISALVGSASAMFSPGDPVAVAASDHEGFDFYEIDISRTPLAMAMISPAFAIDGDDLLISLESAKTLRSALNGQVGEGRLGDNEGFMQFANGLKREGSIVSLSYSDLAASFGAIYGQVAGTAQMMAGGFGDLPLDLSLMPSEQSITKHLGVSYSGGYVLDDGSTFVDVGLSQFEIGDFLPIMATACVVGISIATGHEIAAEPEEVDPYDLVQRHLGEISAGMTVYKISEGGYPDGIDDLVRPLADYPEGCLGKAEAPVDPWGNSYLFRLNDRGKPYLWSAGPDGMDQGGEGDDIVKA